MSSSAPSSLSADKGKVTLAEIRQQPDLWSSTLARVAQADLSKIQRQDALISGAGSSAYAGAAVAKSWPRASALPTTDRLLHSREDILFRSADFASNGVLVSLARSGDSPESAGTLALVHRMFPDAAHLVIVCNEHGQIALSPGATVIRLDPRTNDQGLAMTASFTNLVLAGMAVNHLQLLGNEILSIADRVRSLMSTLEAEAQRFGTWLPERVVILTPPDLAPLGQEAALKILELTSGKVVSMAETYLGLRHGPISFLQKESLVVCIESSDPLRIKYERDLIRELQEKKLGYIALIGSAQSVRELGVEWVPAMTPGLPDRLRTPFEVVFFQLLAHSLSLASGLDPDDPSRGNIITRVVRPFLLYEGGAQGAVDSIA